jgi:hypothetical protein
MFSAGRLDGVAEAASGYHLSDGIEKARFAVGPFQENVGLWATIRRYIGGVPTCKGSSAFNLEAYRVPSDMGTACPTHRFVGDARPNRQGNCGDKRSHDTGLDRKSQNQKDRELLMVAS